MTCVKVQDLMLIRRAAPEQMSRLLPSNPMKTSSPTWRKAAIEDLTLMLGLAG
jgi:hypothetical protein